MIEAPDLVRLFRQALDEKWGYIWGKRGQTWTQEAQEKATREQTVKWGSRWVGRRVADCSGLFAWAFKELGGSIYHGSNTIWKKHCATKGTIVNGVQLPPGAAVFMVNEQGNRHHIGLHIGDGHVIEAKGTYYGVVRSRAENWDEWGLLSDVCYTNAGQPYAVSIPPKTLRRGDRGDEVKRMQTMLMVNGYDLGKSGADGIFGKATQLAVKAFQTVRDLEADGVCGPLTWTALEAASTGKPGTPAPTYTVTITGLDAATATHLLECYPGATSKES